MQIKMKDILDACTNLKRILKLARQRRTSEKVEKMTHLLEIPEAEYDDRQAACAQMRDLLRKYYPDCLLLIFGSTVNGFGARHCDLDLLFLPFPGYCNLDFAPSDKSDPIPDPSSILTGETSKDVLSKFDEWSHLKFIRAILRREKTHVKKVNFIPAKTPTLKIVLSSSKLLCDLSASNRLVVFNSELLQLLAKLDARVKPLVLTLRFWARSLGFLKRSFFSSYAFTLLIIFFLQNTSPPVLPPVEKLVETSGFSRMTAGWETAFVSDVDSVQKSNNSESLGDLLMRFFEFYWNFDFVQNIICLYSGKVQPVKDLKSSQDKRMAEFEASSVNIQDPFIHSRNICKIEGSKIVFKLALHTAHQMLQDKSGKLKFYMLFDSTEYQKVFDLHYEKYMSGRPKVCFINLDYDCIVNLSKIAKNTQLWYDRATETIFDVLQYGLLMECEVTDKISWAKKMAVLHGNNSVGGKHNDSVSNLSDKSPSLNGQSSPYDLELLLSIQCVLYSRTWIGRKNVTEFSLTLDESEEFPGAALKAEYSISRELVKTNPLINSPVPLLCFKCDCYKHTSPQIADIVVMLKPLSVSREFYQVSAFLASYIPKTVKKILASD